MRSDWRAGDVANIASLKSEIDRAEVRLAYLFTAGLDATMHAHTTSSPKRMPPSLNSSAHCAISTPSPSPATARSASIYSAITA